MPRNFAQISFIFVAFFTFALLFVLQVASFLVLLMTTHLGTSLYLNGDPYVTCEI